MLDLNNLNPIIANIDAGIAAGRAAAAKPIRERGAFRAARELAIRGTFNQLEAERIIQSQYERDDAFDPVGEYVCPSCAWIGNSDDAEFPLLKRGGPFSGPLDGATPPEHDDAKCPRCAAYLEDVT